MFGRLELSQQTAPQTPQTPSSIPDIVLQGMYLELLFSYFFFFFLLSLLILFSLFIVMILTDFRFRFLLYTGRACSTQLP
jgi:hypothetical protein